MPDSVNYPALGLILSQDAPRLRAAYKTRINSVTFIECGTFSFPYGGFRNFSLQHLPSQLVVFVLETLLPYVDRWLDIGILPHV